MRALTWILNAVADTQCAACSQPAHAPLCAACEPTVEAAVPAQEVVAEGIIAAPYAYGGALADAIVRSKYGGDTLACARLGELMRPSLEHLVGETSVVLCPVPLTRAKLVERGYNVPALMLRALPKLHCARIVFDGLEKICETLPQASLGRAARVRNMEHAFRAHPSLSGQHVVIVDDVATTGSTLRAAMRACLSIGATTATGFALGRTERSCFGSSTPLF